MTTDSLSPMPTKLPHHWCAISWDWSWTKAPQWRLFGVAVNTPPLMKMACSGPNPPPKSRAISTTASWPYGYGAKRSP